MAFGSLGRAVLEYSADTARFESDVGRAAATFNRSVGNMQRTIAGLRDAFLALSAATGIGMLVKGAIDAGDQLNKLSQKVGVSVESLSGLKLGAELADVSMESFARGMKGFNTAIAEAGDASSQSAGIFRAPEVALRQTADAFKRMEDGAVKTALAVQLFGKSGMDMIPFLNAGSEGMDKATRQARAFGVQIGADFAAKAEQFNDNMKLIGKGAQAMGLAIAEHAVGGLAMLTANIVKATESGQKWTGWAREAAKLSLALAGGMGKLPWWMGPLPLAGNLLDKQLGAAFGAFTLPEGAKNPLDTILDRIAAAKNPPKTAPNPEELACVASGGKWVGGQCQHGGAKGSARDAELERYLRNYRMNLDAINESLKTQGEIDEYNVREFEKNMAAKDAAQQAELDLLARNALKRAQMQDEAEALANQTKKTDDWARQVGLTFASSFENAIVKAQGLRAVVQGLAQDLLRIATRNLVTEPLGAAASAALKPITSGIADWFGGLFKAEGGPVSAGQPYVVGERGPEWFVPGVSGAVVPNAGTNGSTFYIDAKGADPAAIGRLERAIMAINGSIERRALNVVASEAVRGGSFAAALGK